MLPIREAIILTNGHVSALGSFNILVYTGMETEVPVQWQDSDAHLISGNAEQVKLRSFSTSVHKVDSLVAYRLGEE
jgi:mitotic spindle assembly checkpoint protein MAD2